MWDDLFDPNLNNSPPNKESPCKLNYLHTRRSNSLSRYNFFTAWEDDTPYVKHQLQSVTPLHRRSRPLQRSTIAKFLESPTSFTGAYCAFLRHWGDQAHCVFAPLGDLYRRTSPTHTTKLGAWLWYQLKDLGHHPKRLAFRWSYPNPYILKTIPTSSRCGTICSTQIPTIHCSK